MAATTSQYPSALTTFTIPDPVIARLYANIKRDLQPIFDTFGGSPGAAKISWGKGTPTMRHPPGSVYFRTDAVGTSITSIYVKQTATTSPVWSTFAAGDGTGQSLVPQVQRHLVLNYWMTPAATTTYVPAFYTPNPVTLSSLGAWIVPMTQNGSIAAISLCNTGFSIAPAPLTGGSIQAQVFKNWSNATGCISGALNMSTASTYTNFAQGAYPFVAGDLIDVRWSRSAGVGWTTSNAAGVNMSLWVYYNA